MRISEILVYNQDSTLNNSICDVIDSLSELLGGSDIVVKYAGVASEFMTSNLVNQTRIFDLKKPFQQHSADDLTDMLKTEFKAYDGFQLQNILRKCMSAISSKTLCIVITDLLTCTFDVCDFRYHARPIICANPTIISTTSMVEGPAKPKEYYIDVLTSVYETDTLYVDERYEERFLKYHDSRIPKVIEGYLLQTVMYHTTGKEFCDDIQCRLNNSHWQEDLLRLQLETRHLCSYHEGILKNMSR